MYLKKVLTVISIIILIFPYAVVHAAVNEIEDVVGARMLYAHTEVDIVAEYVSYLVAAQKQNEGF